MSKYGGRRFILVIGCALTYTVLLVTGYLGGGEYVTLQSLTIGAYIAGNGHQKHSEIRYGSHSSKRDSSFLTEET